MKVLLDTCVWGQSRAEIEEHGHDVVWAGDWDEDPGDEEILARAHNEHRVLVTLDKDFGELAILRDAPHSGILRLVSVPAKQQAKLCVEVLERHGDELSSGAIITVEMDRLRIRPPESSD